MIRGKYLASSMDVQAVMDVRARVAKAEGQKSGTDCHDGMAVYALTYDEDNEPSGSGRLYLDEDRFMIGCVGVLPEKRRPDHPARPLAVSGGGGFLRDGPS